MKTLTLEQAKEFCLTMTKLKAVVAAEQRVIKAAVRHAREMTSLQQDALLTPFPTDLEIMRAVRALEKLSAKIAPRGKGGGK